MTNGVKVELGGQAHELRLTRRALYRLETETDQTIVEVLDRVQRGSFAAMVNLVWCGLVWAKPNLKPEDVADMLELSDMGEVAKAVVEAMAQLGGPAKGNEQSDTESTLKTGPSVSPQE